MKKAKPTCTRIGEPLVPSTGELVTIARMRKKGKKNAAIQAVNCAEVKLITRIALHYPTRLGMLENRRRV